MQAAQPIANARRLINDPSTDGRWTTQDMVETLSLACQQLMRDILFPECRMTTQTFPNLQRYTLPEIIEIHAVYVQGRLCVPAPSVDVLEGDALQIWDERGFGPAPAIGNAGPSGNTGSFAPRWTIQTPAAFPNANSFSECRWPTPITEPWHTGQRPRYALEGGTLIISPAPSTGPAVINGEIQDNIDVRCVLPHEDVVDLNQPLWFPKSCASTLAWWMVSELLFADETQIAQSRATMALQRYEREKNQRRTDANVFRGARSLNTPKMITGRHQWHGRIGRVDPF